MLHSFKLNPNSDYYYFWEEVELSLEELSIKADNLCFLLYSDSDKTFNCFYNLFEKTENWLHALCHKVFFQLINISFFIVYRGFVELWLFIQSKRILLASTELNSKADFHRDSNFITRQSKDKFSMERKAFWKSDLKESY